MENVQNTNVIENEDVHFTNLVQSSAMCVIFLSHGMGFTVLVAVDDCEQNLLVENLNFVCWLLGIN